MADTLARRLARFAAALRYDDLPPAVVDKAKACILHGLGVGLAGHSSGAVQAARAAVLAEERAAEHGATILVDGAKATVYGAAFVNSALMHAKLHEDAYRTASHPGAMVIPAALAAAESRGASGRELIAAVVAGYEVEAAVTADFTARTTARGFRASPLYGPFGAAAAAGRAIRLTEERLTHALGYAATFAGGTVEGGMNTHLFVLQVAEAPRSGLLAASLAEHGATASATSLDGPRGFYYAFAGGVEGVEHLADHLGRRWEILDVTLKRYPAAMFNQPPIHLMLALVEQHGLRPEAIDAVVVEMNEFEAGYPVASGAGRPVTLGSTAFCVAAACVNRGFAAPADRPTGWSSSVDGFDRLPTHQTTMALAERVQVVPAPDVAPLAPRLTVRLIDGTVYTAQATGDEFKLGFADAAAIVRTLQPEMPAAPGQVERLIEAVRRLDSAATLTELIAAAVRTEAAAS